ncbi:50S ribosomal protein L6 [Candidatus Woesearchaeota archaeon]|jgi:large subunit ribosomal protein L6|nr:50S ribosomal protein L6 [Candidatus Woesearchaeota archaeon]
MKVKNYVEEINIPEGVEAQLDGSILMVKGKKGELKRDFFDPRIKIQIKDNNVLFDVKVLTKREKMLLGTYVAHLNNLFRGVKEGFVYKLKICSGHFPMNVSIKNDEFIIKNFIGEKVPRVLKINSDVKVNIDGEVITIESNNIELAGQTAGSIEKLSSRTGFDKRIFQQGIFIIEKPKRA